jgi:large conductance mechanosensitive channel
MKAFIQEFQKFIMRGNVVDMAVGVVIGAAFNKIVSSAVSDIIMPPIGVLIGGVDFTDLKLVIKSAVMDGTEVVSPEVAINYGSFIQVILDFLIVSFAIFLVIKGMSALKKKKAEEPAPEPAPAAPSEEVQLLTQIRDLLEKK